MNKNEPGVYVEVEDMMRPYIPEPAYYAFFVNIGSWGKRLKAFITKRIEIEPIYIVFDDNSTISHLFITNLNEFYEASKQIDEHIAKIKAKQKCQTSLMSQLKRGLLQLLRMKNDK